MNETLRAAFVIARRDFTALIGSKAFIFFLLGPLVMFGIALVAGGLGSQMASRHEQPVMGIAMSETEATQLRQVHQRLNLATGNWPRLETGLPKGDPATILRTGRGGKGYVAILSGSLDEPTLTTSATQADRWTAEARLLIELARQKLKPATIRLDTRILDEPAKEQEPDRLLTAQIAQTALFLLTMLLAGMVLSNLVEEKTNKIIEILAASISMDAIFLGKLFAMLAMAFVGISVWAGAASAAAVLLGQSLPFIPAPAIGWPAFALLGICYFSTAYLLLGSLFLGIGGMAPTVRDVQTLSMPVTFGQLGIFLFASYTLPQIGKPVEITACLFPFSSPFAMIARAAQQEALWPHLLALAWQMLWAWIVIHTGTTLFRRNVLKSGSTRPRRKWLRPRPTI